MNEKSPESRKSKKSRWIKTAFAVILIIGVVIIWNLQRRDPELAGWSKNLPAAIAEAGRKNTKVFVFFTRSPMGYDDKRMAKESVTEAKVVKSINDLGYIRVHLNLRDNQDEAEKYDVKDGPTLLLLDADGKLLEHHSGFISGVDLSKKFLVVKATTSEPAGSARR
jgi:thiol-disulfide isomerase/thioredoxin